MHPLGSLAEKANANVAGPGVKSESLESITLRLLRQRSSRIFRLEMLKASELLVGIIIVAMVGQRTEKIVRFCSHVRGW